MQGKKLLALILALLMAFSTLPVTVVFADDGDETQTFTKVETMEVGKEYLIVATSSSGSCYALVNDSSNIKLSVKPNGNTVTLSSADADKAAWLVAEADGEAATKGELVLVNNGKLIQRYGSNNTVNFTDTADARTGVTVGSGTVYNKNSTDTPYYLGYGSTSGSSYTFRFASTATNNVSFYVKGSAGTPVDPDEPDVPDVPDEPDEPDASYTYHKVNRLMAGQEYLIVATSTSGSSYLLANASDIKQKVTFSGDSITLSAAEAENVSWTAALAEGDATEGGKLVLLNGGSYLRRSSSNTVSFADAADASAGLRVVNGSLCNQSGYYLGYGSPSTGGSYTFRFASTATDNITFYVKGDAPVEPAIYTVIFKDGDTVLAELTYEEGDSVNYTAPEKAADENYTYEFDHFEPALTTVTGDATYQVIYTATEIDHTVYTYHKVNRLMAGQEYLIVAEGNSSSYALANASNIKLAVTVDGNRIALDAEDAAIATWLVAEADGEAATKGEWVLVNNGKYLTRATSTNAVGFITEDNARNGMTVGEGTIYGRTTAGDPYYLGYGSSGYGYGSSTFRFATAATDNISFYVKSEEEPQTNTYTVIFKDGDTVLAELTYEEGDSISYTAPEKAADENYTYEFDHFEPALTTVTGDATYQVIYTATEIDHTVYTYHKVNRLMAGQEYLIVATSTSGSSYLLANASNIKQKVSFSGDSITLSAAEAENVSWTAALAEGDATEGGKLVLLNGGSYLRRSSSNTVSFADAADASAGLRVVNGSLCNQSGYYLGYGSPSTGGSYTFRFASTATDNITFYVKGDAPVEPAIYTITFKDGDTVLAELTYEEGDSVNYTAPEKAADENYTYEFDHFEPALTTVTGDATYQVIYTATEIDHTVYSYYKVNKLEVGKEYLIVAEGNSSSYALANASNIKLAVTVDGNKILLDAEEAAIATWLVAQADGDAATKGELVLVNNGKLLQRSTNNNGVAFATTADARTGMTVGSSTVYNKNSSDTPYYLSYGTSGYGYGSNTFTFATTATGNVSFYVKSEEEPQTKTYTVVFKDGDTVLAELTYEEGDTIRYTAPEKAADENYTYEFDHFEPALTTVTGDATYQVIYTATEIDHNVYTYHKVNRLMAGQEYLIVATSTSGSSYLLANASDIKQKVTFSGDSITLSAAEAENVSWTAALAEGDATEGGKLVLLNGGSYLRRSSSNTVSFADAADASAGLRVVNGSLCNQSGYYLGYGSPSTGGSYTFRFASTATDNVTFYVKGDAPVEPAIYTVIFKDGDTVLAELTYEEGDTIRYTAPEKAADENYTYEFDHFEPALTTVTGDATYQVIYTATEIDHTVYSYYKVNKLEVGKEYLIVAEGNSSSYALANASNIKLAVTVDGNKILLDAEEAAIATWLVAQADGDAATKGELVLVNNGKYLTRATSTNAVGFITEDNARNGMTEGEGTIYGRTTANDPYYLGYGSSSGSSTFRFATTATNNISFYVKSEEEPQTNRYTVNWVVEGETVYTATFEEGTQEPAYVGETPVKAATAQYTYSFAGWEKTEEGLVITYTASFSETLNSYTVIFKDGDTVLAELVYAYGATIDYAAPEKEGYTSRIEPALTTVTGDATYQVIYTAVVTTLRGDVDGNGVISIRDVSALLGILSRQEEDLNPEQAAQRDRSDVNGDSIVSIGDVSALLTILATSDSRA